ncbi:MAG TPA: hypothetical protein DCR97_00225 [Deltaproteobacteria bacterium]|nr:hypothetical protein [Deltaproteobacteria bacterium]
MFGNFHELHVQPLARALKTRADYHISLLESVPPGDELLRSRPTAFDHVYSIPVASEGLGRVNCLRQVGKLLLRRKCVSRFMTLYRLLAPMARTSSSRQYWKQFCRTADELQRRALLSRIVEEFDLFHLHYMDPSLSETIRLLPRGSKLIVSIWGSDLMRSSGARNYIGQLELCERASFITVRSLELREMFLTKFGRHFAPKLRIAKFGSTTLSRIDVQDIRSLRTAFREEFTIPENKVIVCVGHNGNVDNRHIEVLEALSGLDSSVKNGLTLVIPMTYGAPTGYANDVRAAVERAGGDFRIIDKFMDSEAVLQLRAATDIMLHFPVSDALSAAMCETIYAGNLVVTGAWLPYGELRRRKVHFLEITRFPDLCATLAASIGDLTRHRAMVNSTKEKLREVLDWEELSEGWEKVYASALGNW